MLTSVCASVTQGAWGLLFLSPLIVVGTSMAREGGEGERVGVMSVSDFCTDGKGRGVAVCVDEKELL